MHCGPRERWRWGQWVWPDRLYSPALCCRLPSLQQVREPVYLVLCSVWDTKVTEKQQSSCRVESGVFAQLIISHSLFSQITLSSVHQEQWTQSATQSISRQWILLHSIKTFFFHLLRVDRHFFGNHQNNEDEAKESYLWVLLNKVNTKPAGLEKKSNGLWNKCCCFFVPSTLCVISSYQLPGASSGQWCWSIHGQLKGLQCCSLCSLPWQQTEPGVGEFSLLL